MLAWADLHTDGMEDRKDLPLNKFGSEPQRIWVGNLGQVMSFITLGGEPHETYEHDIVIRGRTYECKNVTCSGKPLPHYLATVNSPYDGKMRRQKADFYLFLRSVVERRIGWIVGFMPCEEFMMKGKFVPKGASPFPGYRFEKADSTVLEIHRLIPPGLIP